METPLEKAANLAAVRNPSSLEYFVDYAKARVSLPPR